MRLCAEPGVHLTYCTNIHAGETWPEVRQALERHLPVVKRRLAPDTPFGVGLRLSAVAADALAQGRALGEFKAFLQHHDLYVFTINGFPYGPFHGRRVKEAVYLPDWRDPERLRYTCVLADLLVKLLPADDAMTGSVSTVPGAFRPSIRGDGDIDTMRAMLVRAVAHLVRLRQATGRSIALALEPEPCCFLETVEEAIRFIEDELLSARSLQALADHAGLGPSAAEEAMRGHLGICLDLCHAAVEFEEPLATLAALRDAGISVPKMQLSAGLRFVSVSERTIELLRPFDDDVYLHQVVERNGAGLTRFADLADAFDGLAAGSGQREWRVHFHVPIFLDDLGDFGTTQGFMREVLAEHRRRPISTHLEVETYTWDVLPEAYRGDAIDAAIARELTWVRDQLRP